MLSPQEAARKPETPMEFVDWLVAQIDIWLVNSWTDTSRNMFPIPRFLFDRMSLASYVEMLDTVQKRYKPEWPFLRRETIRLRRPVWPQDYFIFATNREEQPLSEPEITLLAYKGFRSTDDRFVGTALNPEPEGGCYLQFSRCVEPRDVDAVGQPKPTFCTSIIADQLVTVGKLSPQSALMLEDALRQMREKGLLILAN